MDARPRRIVDGTVCRQATDDSPVLIDEVTYWAGEAHFGGNVVQPEP